MTSVPISLKTNGASGMANTGMAGGSRSELEALQKKMTGLIKQLKEASHDTSPGAKERLKLLELAIKACQMQIEQLMNADAQKAAKEAAKKAEESAQPDAANGASSSIGIPGAQIDTHA